MGLRQLKSSRRVGGGRPVLALLLALSLVALPTAGVEAKPKSRTPSIAAAIVVDMNSGRILEVRNADAPRHPASLTKIMTLYMLFSYMRTGAINLDSELVVTPHAARQSPTKLGVKAGQTVRVSDAIKALVTLSANDVAVTVAENIAGTEANFARMMTDKARSLGMRSTVFRNASGLPNEEQTTTARDMAILAHHMIRDFPEYYDCFETKVFTYKGRSYRNHNKLLFGYKGTDGIKTGYTRAAGFNLTASVRRDNKHLIAVVLGGRTGSQRDAAMRSLLDANFAKATTKQSAPLIASRGGLAPGQDATAQAAPKRRIFALASTAPEVNPLSFGGQEAQGSRGTEVPPPQAATPAAIPDPVPLAAAPPAKKTGKTATRKGPFHVQVGAYANQQEAERRLGVVQSKAASLLDGYSPVTTVFEKDDTQWYRARFAGFSKGSAETTCGELKRMDLDCVVMRAN